MPKNKDDKNNQLPVIKVEKELLVYNTPDGNVRVEVLLQDENIWLTQDKISELFGIDRSVVTKHLSNIFKEGELDEKSNVQKMHIANSDKRVKFYNLDTIISVGYRVNSRRATMFRIWATERLKEYIIKGFTMDDERLKTPNYTFGQDYFEEQLERIKDIRSSERRIYQKITDIYIQCSADYKADDDITKLFFATVQNKLHFSITGQTAAEIVYSRADSNKEHMGLTTWKNAPHGKIRKADASVAKNYLDGKEMFELNEIVAMYLDYAERQARRRQVMNMEDWIVRLDSFLKFNEEEILNHAGKISAEVAKQFAESEFEKYNAKQIAAYQNDFDKLVKRIDNKKDEE